MSRLIVFGAIAIALALGLGFAVAAQDQATPTGVSTSEEVLCATPLAETAASPAIVVTAEAVPSSAASPVTSEPGDEIGLFPCGTPTT